MDDIIGMKGGDNMTVGGRIKQRRLALHMSINELADRLGKNRATVYRYESDYIENLPTSVLEPLAKALETTPSALMGWDFNEAEGDNLVKLVDSMDSHFGARGVDLVHELQSNPNSRPAETERVLVPKLGNVAAGLGCLAENLIIGYEPFDKSSIKHGHDYICLEVKGDSMYPKLEEGDLVLIQCQSMVDSGKIAVLTVNGEDGVIKKVVYGKGWLELHSINPMYPPRRFEGEDTDIVQIVGLVVESKRKF